MWIFVNFCAARFVLSLATHLGYTHAHSCETVLYTHGQNGQKQPFLNKV